MTLIDTHSHVYLHQFDSDREKLMERAAGEGVSRIFLPAIDHETHVAMIKLEESYPAICSSMMGLHPCSVKGDYEEELTLIRDHLASRKFAGVGEIGLDFYWDLSFKDQQYRAFHDQIEMALHYDIPISIHSREATQECIEVVAQHQKGKLKGVFHCFTGNTAQAKEVMDLGFYLGIGGVVTFKNGGLDPVIKTVGLDRVVLETDAPYLAPVPFRGKRNEPAYLKYIAEKLGDIQEISMEEVARITTLNAQKLFNI